MRRLNNAVAEMTVLEARRHFAGYVLDTGYGDDGLVPGGNSVWQIIGRRTDGQLLFGVDYGGGQQVRSIKPDGSYGTFQFENNFYDSVSSDFYLAPDDRTYYMSLPRVDSYEPVEQLPAFSRFNADGTMDDAYGHTILPRPGKYKTIRAGYFGAGQLKVDSQGRAMALSTAEYYKPDSFSERVYQRTFIERLLPNGGRDTSFGDAGRILVTTNPGQAYLYVTYAIMPDDGFVFSRAKEGEPITITRYTASGAIDPSFADSGTLTIHDSTLSGSHYLSVDDSGRLLVGYKPHATSNSVRVRRYTASGASDTSFSSDGVTTITNDAFAPYAYSSLQVLEDSGEILGSASGGLFRLSPDGEIDGTFGQSGVINTGHDYLYYTLPTPEGIYAATKIGERFGVGRYVETDTARKDEGTGLLTISGTNASDTISVVASSDGVRVTLNGQAAQTFVGVTGVLVSALEGDDNVVVDSLALPASINLGAGNDRLTAGDSPVRVTGAAGNDTIASGAGIDSIDAGAGNDSVVSGEGDDTIETGDGNDIVDAGLGRDRVTNRAGADVIDLGAGGGTFIYGDRSGGDTDPQIVLGQGGPNTRYNLQLGQGSDRVSIVGGSIVVDAGIGEANRISALARVAAIIQTAGGDDTIVTGDGADEINSYIGKARISAGAGDDTIQTGYGRDTINCGEGNDVVTDFGGHARVYGGDGNDSIRTGAGRDVIFGDAGSDTLRSGAGDDLVDGGFGRDLLFGSSGNDTLIGGGNNDRLYGGAGADQLFGSAGDDSLFDQRDALDLTSIDTLDGGAGVDRGLFDPEDDETSIEVVL